MSPIPENTEAEIGFRQVSLEMDKADEVGPLHHDDVMNRNGEPSGSASVDATSSSPWAYATATMALCMCTLTHSYLLISVFPYSGFLAIDLIPGVNEENAGSYAGFIASSFMIGRAASSFLWGKLADIYGRTTVLYASLAFSCLFSILFGLAQTFAWAIAFRCLLGVGNGMIATAKTAVSELAGDDPVLEMRGMGIVLGMWGWGFLLSPAISGALAEPVRQYPDSSLVQRFEGVLSKYPFILPNLVGVAFCITTMVAVLLFVPETLPQNRLRSSKLIFSDFVSWCHGLVSKVSSRASNDSSIEITPIVSDGSASNETDQEGGSRAVITTRRPRLKAKQSDLYLTVPTDEVEQGDERSEANSVLTATRRPKLKSKQSELYLTVKTEETGEHRNESQATMSSLWSKQTTRQHLIIYWIFSFVVIAVDEAFPLFCISKEAGLGLSEASIGRILSGSGLIFAVSQYFVYSFLVDRFGLYGSIDIGGLVTAPLIALIPVSVMWHKGTQDEELSWMTFFFLCIVMAVLRVFCLAFFSSITIATNRTVPTSERASMNGLSMLGGSVFKAVGPAFAGLLVTFSLSSGLFAPRIGAFFIFFVIGAIALATSVCSVRLLGIDSAEESQTVSS